MYQSSRDKFDGTQLYSTLALWLLWSLARSICSKGEQKGSTSGAHNGGVVAMAAAAAFSLEEGSQGKQGMARQEKAWHGGQFWWDTVSWMELARFSFFSTGGVKSHSFIAQLNCKWFHELCCCCCFLQSFKIFWIIYYIPSSLNPMIICSGDVGCKRTN